MLHLLNMTRKLCFPNSMIFHKNVKIAIWIPEGSCGACGDLAESPVGPSDALQMVTLYAKSKRNRTFCKIDVKLTSKPCKTNKSNICGRFPLYFICFLNGWNDKFLTHPSQTLIAHDIHNYNELKRM